MTSSLRWRWTRPLALAGPMLVASVACSTEETSGDSGSASTANGISCDVDYTRLDAAWAARLHVVEPTAHRISDRERLRHLNELALMPAASKALFVGVPLDVALTGGSIVEFREFAELAGVTPPGWEGTPFTWDVVPGTGSKDAVFLGDSAKPNNAYSLAIHEATHTIDLFTSVTDSSRLRALYEADRAAPRPEQDSLTVYRLSNIHEYLAVAVDEHSCNSATRAALARRFPALNDYVENDFDREVEVLSRRLDFAPRR